MQETSSQFASRAHDDQEQGGGSGGGGAGGLLATTGDERSPKEIADAFRVPNIIDEDDAEKRFVAAAVPCHLADEGSDVTIAQASSAKVGRGAPWTTPSSAPPPPRPRHPTPPRPLASPRTRATALASLALAAS